MKQEDACEAYDWLPSIVRSLTPAIKELCYSSNSEVASYTLPLVHLAVEQGLVYGVDWVECVLHHLASPHRTVLFRVTHNP